MKQNQNKSYQQRVLNVLVYIQKNLDKELSLKELANIACFSEYHFHRIFTAISGESVFAYIRRLKIQKAAGECIYFPNKNITDIALDAGFSSASAFNKAFQTVMGITPSLLRKTGTVHEYKNPSLHSITPRNNEDNMQPKLVKNTELTMLFIRETGDYSKTAPAAWQKIRNFIHQHNLSLTGCQLVGYAHDDPAITIASQCRFDAGIVGLSLDTIDHEFGTQILAGGKYAIYEHHGAFVSISDTFKSIYGSWLSQAGLEVRNEPPFCVYDTQGIMHYPSLTNEQREALVTLIYMPVY